MKQTEIKKENKNEKIIENEKNYYQEIINKNKAEENKEKQKEFSSALKKTIENNEFNIVHLKALEE